MAIKKILLCILAALPLLACEGNITNHGYVADSAALDQIQIGSSQEQVRLVMGTPSLTSEAGTERYYYVSSTKKQVAFLAPKVIDRRVLAFQFDQERRVSKVANYGIKDGVVFDFISRRTPTRGDELTVLRQIFGNIGSFTPQ